MNTTKMYELLNKTTIQLRKGEMIENKKVGNLDVTEIYMMPHETELKNPDEFELVDIIFVTIGVHKESAEKHKQELIELLNDYPDQTTLKSGPSYITVGADIGSQDYALMLFALGDYLKLWKLITPKTFGFEGDKILELAGGGFVMISGYDKESKVGET